jgi:protein TonB
MHLFPTPFLQRHNKQAATIFWALALSLTAFVSQAQKSPVTLTMALVGSDPTLTAYTGPRYPGGPDSLRAVLARQLRLGSPALVGQVFLHLEFDKAGTVQKGYLLTPPRATPAAALAYTKEVQALASQLGQRLVPWQPGPGAPDQYKATLNTVTLPLTFGPTPAAPALLYSDENPTFPAGRGDQHFGVTGFLQKQIRYPAEDLRNNVQGVVYAYFEVSETGAVEQRRIVGTVSPTLDAEVLRVLQLLPDARTPPRLAGRPVRVAYVLPLNFKIQ